MSRAGTAGSDQFGGKELTVVMSRAGTAGIMLLCV